MVDRAEVETWTNASAGMIALKKFDHRGEPTKVEVIHGGRQFHISRDERQLNQMDAASEDLDVFRNGMLTPVKLIEDDEEARELANNPNAMGETEMRQLVRSHPKTFEKRLGDVTNPIALERLLRIAREEDVTVRRVEQIEARLVDTAPSIFASQNTDAPTSPRAVTPR